MEIKTPKVTLVTHTAHPLETVYSVWEASKGDAPYMSPEEVKRRIDPAAVRELFRAVIKQRIPIGEHVDFVFLFENISVSWREQAVRHRIGTLPSPERVGSDLIIDIIPDLADSSWWSQSGRIRDAGQFASRGDYRVPETILEHPDRDRLLDVYRTTMREIQEGYSTLVAAGIPMEDARELMPLGMQHRMSWRLNISSLQHIVGKRGCWILQLGIWGPIITGMIKELVDKVDPIFAELVSPPCVSGDSFKGCVYHEECRRRYTGDDKLPPCPLHFRQHFLPEQGAVSGDIANAHTSEIQAKYRLPLAPEMRRRALDYVDFWGRDPYTGKRL
jgi:hypothetical protein